jgi:L-threonylcarbamoyladenylate synthase
VATDVSQASHSDILNAAEELRSGGIVAFPTETVYGLGADASNANAIAKIFAAKGRPADHPLIVHIADASALSEWSASPPDAAYQLAEQFWPGPLTLILPGSKAPQSVTGGQSSVGLRAPSHPIAQALIRAFNGGIAAPSANRFGRISPTHSQHVREELGDQVKIILEGGNCEVGLESTILSLVDPIPCLLRPGAISQSALEATLGTKIAGIERSMGIRASGLLESHYAPRTPLRVVESDQIAEWIQKKPGETALMALTPPVDPGFRSVVLMPDNASAYGQRLYATLRELDSGAHDLIIAERPPRLEPWAAIQDRLQRASHESTTR